jgi:hypothetical protein
MDHETHVSAEKARAGTTPHIVRYILFISFALVVLGMAFVLFK